ncbi:MAG: leucine--tRNA ligase, partial [bacterium]|nr:leucine--tRNA ligase [bacterium]
MKPYDHKKIEKKWQEEWETSKIYEAKDDPTDSTGSPQAKPKFYSLIEFPFPSGDGMHTGHLRSNTAMDIISRKRRMEGYNVLYPIGWDAFGLPTENYAIKTGLTPQVVTKKNTDTFRKQLKSAGFSFDWSREINTSDPKYYKWTQWIFLQMYKKGLAYKKKMVINWCPKDKIGLANEEVIDGKCERCGTAVEKREKEQWMLAITKYADRLDKDLDDVNYLEKIKIQQRNWIGRSEGAEIEFQIVGGEVLKVFTTRPDTIFGATYMVVAPEHDIIKKLKSDISNLDEVEKYITQSKNKTEIERTAEDKEKTGVELKGVKAINPATGEEIPVYVADYVLAHYGTGAIMAVPAHDTRDHAFAEKYNLPIIEVVDEMSILKDSGIFTGKKSEKIKKEITESVGGKMVTTFKLRDWIFSRQRYWGEPIPMVHCEKCSWIPVLEKDLPVKLPEVENYQPTDNGESPLAAITDWVNTTCPECNGPAKRETDTMPNWAGSSWYYLRYIDPENDTEFASAEKLKYWTPVDWYNGGMEHTTLHLLYSRFWHKFLFDEGLVSTSEPYQKRTSHGLILAEGGEKMSKSKGNVVNPDSIIENFGADTLRMYEMFMGPFDQSVVWSMDGIVGPRRFLEKVWRMQDKVVPKLPFDAALESDLHKTMKKVAEDIEKMSFNTAVSALMILANEMDKRENIAQAYYQHFLKLLAPFAPHITEELWSELGHKMSIHLSKWDNANESKIQVSEVKMVVQVNGKVRAEFMVQAAISEAEARTIALG